MKKRWLIVVILLASLALVALFVLGYTALKGYVERSTQLACFERVSEYVKTDDFFEQRYGSAVADVSLYDDENILEEINPYQVIVSCIVTVESGETYLHRVEYLFGPSREQFFHMDTYVFENGRATEYAVGYNEFSLTLREIGEWGIVEDLGALGIPENVGPISSREQAIAVGKEILKNANFTKKRVFSTVIYDGETDLWCLLFVNDPLAYGGGLEIYVNASDGQVLRAQWGE